MGAYVITIASVKKCDFVRSIRANQSLEYHALHIGLLFKKHQEISSLRHRIFNRYKRILTKMLQLIM